MSSIEDVCKHRSLLPHPEGGYFRETINDKHEGESRPRHGLPSNVLVCIFEMSSCQQYAALAAVYLSIEGGAATIVCMVRI